MSKQPQPQPTQTQSSSNPELENFKNLKTIWKNTYDKMLELKIANKKFIELSKNEIFDEEKKKVDNKYDKLYKEEEIRSKIALSEKKNEANIKKITVKNKFLNEVVEKTRKEIIQLANPSNVKYQELIRSLIIQGLTQLLEPVVVLRVREEDKAFIESISSQCADEYTKIMKKETGRDYTCQVKVDSHSLETRLGGVHLFDESMKIQCTNDHESRLELSYVKILPDLKKKMFE